MDRQTKNYGDPPYYNLEILIFRNNSKSHLHLQSPRWPRAKRRHWRLLTFPEENITKTHIHNISKHIPRYPRTKRIQTYPKNASTRFQDCNKKNLMEFSGLCRLFRNPSPSLSPSLSLPETGTNEKNVKIVEQIMNSNIFKIVFKKWKFLCCQKFQTMNQFGTWY